MSLNKTPSSPLQVVSTRELEQLHVGAVLDLRQPPVRCKTESGGMALTLRWVAVLAAH